MIEPLTERQQALIVSNVVRACEDIGALNRTGYRFIYLASGFIAHYDIGGFKSYYEDHSLEDDILANAQANMWFNFQPSDPNYDYYMTRRRVYQEILIRLKETV